MMNFFLFSLSFFLSNLFFFNSHKIYYLLLTCAWAMEEDLGFFYSRQRERFVDGWICSYTFLRYELFGSFAFILRNLQIRERIMRAVLESED